MLSYCLAHSGVEEWKIETISEKQYLMDYLSMLVMDQLSLDAKSHFKLQIIEGTLIQLSPVNPKVSTPIKSKSNIFCRLIRELLHRFLQLYSPIKLKSDGSNVSYVSVLACKCLQDQMETRNLLTLEPITAVHWLPVKPKEKKSSAQNDTNPQTLFHMQQHGNQHVEFVLMTSPYPDRIRFIMPGTRDEIVIELSTNNSPNFNLTGIEDHLDLNGTRSRVFHHETHFDTSHAKLILPSLPLPDQTHSKSVTLAPEVSEPPRTPMQRQRLFENLETITTPHPDTLQQSTVDSVNRIQGQITIHNRCEYNAGAYGSPFSCLNGSTLEPIQTSQSQKLSAVKPGVIIHSSIPNVFVADEVYPIPDKTRLLRLRKGGNGEVFVGIFNGAELIVKI